jgi:putative glycerol-1-phosphate prenyltransferase
LANIYERLFSGKKKILVLLDPDKTNLELIEKSIKQLERKRTIFGFLVGSSIMMRPTLDNFVERLKNISSLPVILFPGSVSQLTPKADAILFLILISGRNPEYLIGEQVKAAPFVKFYGMEAIPTAYMLIESGNYTSVEFMSYTRPIPRDKTDIAVAHAMAAEIMGMKAIYLEAGSGASLPVPPAMIKEIKSKVQLPLIVGGGIKNKENVEEAFNAGADVVVIGTAFEKNSNFFEDF